MSADDDTVGGPFGPISRRTAIGSTLLAGAAFLAAHPLIAQESRGAAASVPRKRCDMKRSINLWAFPYPQKMTLLECLQLAKDAVFDGIELNYDLESDLSPKAGEFHQIRSAADRIGIAISGVCSFLFWPFPLTSNDPAKRARGPRTRGPHGACRTRFRSGEPAGRTRSGAYSVAGRSRTRAERRLRSPRPRGRRDPRETAETLKVSLNIENIFFNAYICLYAPRTRKTKHIEERKSINVAGLSPFQSPTRTCASSAPTK
jgi:hypothetical protein